MSASASQLFQQGDIAAAVAAMSVEVKNHPTDIAMRSTLTELLCVGDDLERADLQLAAIAQQDPTTAVQVSRLRQIVRAGEARRQVFRDGRPPELLASPPEHIGLRLEALMHLREGRPEAMAACLSRAEEVRPVVSGCRDDVPFDDFRDLDDLMGGTLEVMTTTGKYFWVPMEQVEQIEFQAPSRILDSAWRMAQISVREGPQGEVAIPTRYPVLSSAGAPPLPHGGETNWMEIAPGCVCGEGVRSFLVGEDSCSILELRRLEFGAR